MLGKLYLCATPIGNLSDITLRAIEVLKSVDLIAAEDTRHTLGLLNHLGIEKPLTSYYEHNRKEKGNLLIEKLKSGENIALVSDAGTPAISDPGFDLVNLCSENGIDVVPVPGACAVINALIVSGIDCSRFAFEGFLTVNKSGRREHLKKIQNEERTMVFYEAPHKLLTTLKDLLSFFGDRKISLCRELTKIHEEVLRTTLKEAIALYENQPPKGEFVLVVEGKSPDLLKEEDRDKWKALSEEEHILYYVNQGLSEKEALKAAAKDRGISKRQLYDKVKIGRD